MPSPSWVPWFEFDTYGIVCDAGVDTQDRNSNVAITTCDFNRDYVKDPELYNETVLTDTCLMAVSPTLLSTCGSIQAVADYFDNDCVTSLRGRLEQIQKMANEAIMTYSLMLQQARKEQAAAKEQTDGDPGTAAEHPGITYQGE